MIPPSFLFSTGRRQTPGMNPADEVPGFGPTADSILEDIPDDPVMVLVVGGGCTHVKQVERKDFGQGTLYRDSILGNSIDPEGHLCILLSVIQIGHHVWTCVTVHGSSLSPQRNILDAAAR